MADTSITIDNAKLQRLRLAMREYAVALRKDNAAVLNRAAGQLAYRAMLYTHKASPDRIRQELLQEVAVQVFNRRGKRLKKPFSYTQATTYGMVQMLIKMRKGTLYYRGFPNGTDPRQFTRTDLQIMARKYVNRRISSAAFIASGFKPAFLAFMQAYRSGTAGLSAQFRPGKGYGVGIVAVPGDKSTAVIQNLATTLDPSSHPALLKYGIPGMDKALTFVTADMSQYALEALKKNREHFKERTR